MPTSTIPAPQNARNFPGLQNTSRQTSVSLPGLLDSGLQQLPTLVPDASPILCPPSIIRQFIIPVIIYQSPSQAAIRPPSCHLVYTYRAPASTSAARDAALLPRRLVKRQEPIVQGLESLDRQTAPPHTKSRPSSSGQRQTSKTKPSRLHRCIGSTAIIARPSCA